MAFVLKVQKGVPVPTAEELRDYGTRSTAMDIPWSGMTVTVPGAKDTDTVSIPREFWYDRGVSDEDIDADGGIAKLKDKIRRNFYAWQAKDKEHRKSISLSLANRRDKDGRFTHLDAFLFKTEGTTAPAARGGKTKKAA